MARKSTKPERHLEPEDESQDIEALEATEPDEDEEDDDADQPKMSKVDAIRAALAAGKESPDEGTSYVRDHFGLEISKTHWSATKSQLKRKEGLGTTKAARTPRAAKQDPAPEPAPTPAPRAKAAPAAQQAPALESGMISDLAAVKALVKRLGAQQVKDIADLFED